MTQQRVTWDVVDQSIRQSGQSPRDIEVRVSPRSFDQLRAAGTPPELRYKGRWAGEESWQYCGYRFVTDRSVADGFVRLTEKKKPGKYQVN